jgi:hypothetical protein
VAATYASDAKTAAAPPPVGSAAGVAPPEAERKLRDAGVARELEAPKEAPPSPQGAAPSAETKPGDDKNEASVATEPGAAAPVATPAAPGPEKIVLEEEPAAKEGEAAPAPPPGPFDKEAARIALEVAGARAQGCRKETDPSGTARVIVTFAPSGRVTSAAVSGEPYAGTEIGGCLASAFRGAIVPAYAGSPVTVSKTIVIH